MVIKTRVIFLLNEGWNRTSEYAPKDEMIILTAIASRDTSTLFLMYVRNPRFFSTYVKLLNVGCFGKKRVGYPVISTIVFKAVMICHRKGKTANTTRTDKAI